MSIDAGSREQPRPRRLAGDQGFTFVETVVTVVLLAIIVVPIMSAVLTSIRVSTITRSASQAQTAMINAADRINRAPLSCDYTLYAQAAVQTEGWSPDRASVQQAYYSPQTDTWTDDPPGDPCPGAPGATVTDDLVQKVTITITTPDSQIRRTIQVVKSNV
jgi:prepilin-type N-terminal cleavage/methylation domain-containing protein